MLEQYISTFRILIPNSYLCHFVFHHNDPNLRIKLFEENQYKFICAFIGATYNTLERKQRE